jgi:hypothetical protein
MSRDKGQLWEEARSAFEGHRYPPPDPDAQAALNRIATKCLRFSFDETTCNIWQENLSLDEFLRALKYSGSDSNFRHATAPRSSTLLCGQNKVSGAASRETSGRQRDEPGRCLPSRRRTNSERLHVVVKNIWTSGSVAPGPVADDEAGRSVGGLLSARTACSPLNAAAECRRQRVENVGAYCAGPRRAPQTPGTRRRPGTAGAPSMSRRNQGDAAPAGTGKTAPHFLHVR